MEKRHTHQYLKKEPYQQSSSDSFQWEAAESDTESLVQERAFQQQLRLNISNGSHGEAVNISHETNEDSGDEDLRVFDSLEMSHFQPVRLNCLGCQRNEMISQVFQDEAYSHLHCGPNPKVMSKAAGRPQEGPLISVDDSFLATEEKLNRAIEEGVKKDGYMLIASTTRPVMMTPRNNRYDQPYLLHPQYIQNNASATPPPLHRDTLQASPSRETHKQLANGRASSESTEERAEPNQNQTQAKTAQQMDKLARAQKPLEDIVERNKLTLGRNASKYGSYSKTHALRIPQTGAKAQQAPKETSSSESRSEVQLQQTQQVKVSQRSKGKKAERKESLIPTRPQQPPAPGVKAEDGDCLSSPLTKATVKSLNKAPSSSQPLAPTVQRNIDNTLHFPPFTSQKGQECIINFMSGQRRQHINPQLQIGLSMVHPDDQWNLENAQRQWQRVAAFKEHLLFEDEDQKESPTEDQSSQQIPGTPSSTLSQSSSSYRVLPPIGQPAPQIESGFSPTQPGQRRESDGYLVQMEKKLLRTRPAYKTYSLKDYRQLQPAVTLHGLGPDYTAVEKTKMRRQKLYSNAIREHNKKTSRIPRLPARDLETNGKKVPRIKALEYAKTIAKPLVPGQSKEKREANQTEDLGDHASCVDGLDLSQLTALELLRKRHEEEKQAVALLRKIHAV